MANDGLAETLHWVRTPTAKTRMLERMAYDGAREPLVRQTAMLLARRWKSWQHEERLRSLCRFVSSIPYIREEIERFQAPSVTLTQGGDCDDHTITLLALAWSLRYPGRARMVYPQAEGWPGHYQPILGYPEASEPQGDERTMWIPCETILPASRAHGFGLETEELVEFSRGQRR